jgi:hypothetical protein
VALCRGESWDPDEIAQLGQLGRDSGLVLSKSTRARFRGLHGEAELGPRRVIPEIFSAVIRTSVSLRPRHADRRARVRRRHRGADGGE